MALLAFLQNLDIQILEFIRTHFVVYAPWFNVFIITFSDSEPIIFSLFLVGLWIWGIRKHDAGPKHVALDLCWHVLGAFAIYVIINHILPIRPRPESVTSLPPLLNHLPDNSFPSGHAMFWGASWWALHTLLGWKKTTWAFFFLGLITCFTRVVAGIHYPGDILVGFLLGWIIVQILVSLPHGEKYRKYGQEMIVKIASFMRL